MQFCFFSLPTYCTSLAQGMYLKKTRSLARHEQVEEDTQYNSNVIYENEERFPPLHGPSQKTHTHTQKK